MDGAKGGFDDPAILLPLILVFSSNAPARFDLEALSC
jgi:hypothetical protein